MTPATKNGPSSEDDSNDGGEYCICRGPDDHRMMVYCDGGCDDWYHCSCLKIDVADAKELLDRFICPKCQTETLFTTWKRMCRYWNVGKYLNDPNACRNAARVSNDPPSKYCSDEHREAFWEFAFTHLARQGSEPSRGGRLNVGEVGWLLSQVKTAAELHTLGSKPKLPVKEGADPSKPQLSNTYETYITNHFRPPPGS
jgi:COMPASS component SPP1